MNGELFTKEGHMNSQRMLDELIVLYPQGYIMYVLEAWQIFQRIVMQLSTDKEKILRDLNF